MTGDPRVVAGDCEGRSLAPAQSCSIGVRLQRASAGSAEGTLVVQAQPGGQAVVMVSGTVLPLEGPSLAPNAIDFGSVTVGASSAPVTTTLTNTGGAPATVGQASVSTTEFAITADTCSNATVPAGQSCGITLVFRPNTTGDKSALLTLKVPGACGELAAAVTLGGVGFPSRDGGP